MNTTKIKLLTFYSDSHKELYETFFLDSYNKYLKDSFELNVKHIDQLSPTADFGSEGFEETMFEKIKHIINNIDLSDDNIMVFADCDIQFFSDFSKDIREQLGDFNIRFQDDVACICAGFFVCKQNEESLKFFNTVLHIMESNLVDNKLNNGISDQIIMNQLIRNKNFNKVGMLPKDKYFTVAASNHGARRWNGEKFTVPKNIMVHHGNWTVGLDNKTDLMYYVKNEVEKK